MTDLGLDYESPITFSPRQRLILAAAPPLVAGYLRVACATNRSEVLYPERFAAATASGAHVLVAAFHESLGLACMHYRDTGAHTLTSYSFDGELAAQVVRGIGMRAIRGSSSRGGYKALKELAKAVSAVDLVGITVDGPKGPRRVVKPGLAILSARTGVPVIPHALVATKCWRVRSWDRLIVPKPFGAIVSAYGEPIRPPARMTSESIEDMRLEIERNLNALHNEIEERYGLDPLL